MIENDLEKIFKFFGDEKDAKKIAINIGIERKKGEINTKKLVKIIEKTKRRKNFKIHNVLLKFFKL